MVIMFIEGFWLKVLILLAKNIAGAIETWYGRDLTGWQALIGTPRVLARSPRLRSIRLNIEESCTLLSRSR